MCCRRSPTAPIGEVIRGILPFLILLLIVLGIITYVPDADAVAAARGVWLVGEIVGAVSAGMRPVGHQAHPGTRAAA